jgi:hypothetical protein
VPYFIADYSAMWIETRTSGREAAKLPHKVIFLDLLFPFYIYTLAVFCYFLLQTMILVKILADYFRFYPFAEIL